jgi:hypothetical protein
MSTGTISGMWSLILIGVLYVLALGVWRYLGGFGSAGEAFRTWGRSNSAVRSQPGSSS